MDLVVAGHKVTGVTGVCVWGGLPDAVVHACNLSCAPYPHTHTHRPTHHPTHTRRQGYAVEGSEAGGAGAGESGEDEEDEEEEEEAEDLQQETQVDEEASTRHGDTGARAGIAGPAAAGGPGRAPRRYKRRLRMDERGGFWAP